MPAYATLSHVAALAPKRTFTATSVPSASQVLLYLEHSQAEIDAILAGDGYQVPVPTTATIALKYLERVTTIGAWSKVEEAAQISDSVERAIKMWELTRKELSAGTVQLADAPRLGGENFARAQFAATPMFTRDMAL